MNEVLGLVDSLEAMVLESGKIPMTDKLIIPEKKIIQLIDKIRYSLKNGDSAKYSIDVNKQIVQEPVVHIREEASHPISQEKMQNAEEKARQIREGADQYAEQVLTNLQLMVTKLQNQMIKLEQSIENGREVLEDQRKKELENVQEFAREI